MDVTMFGIYSNFMVTGDMHAYLEKRNLTGYLFVQMDIV